MTRIGNGKEICKREETIRIVDLVIMTDHREDLEEIEVFISTNNLASNLKNKVVSLITGALVSTQENLRKHVEGTEN